MLDYFGIGVPALIGITCIIAYIKRYKYFRTPMKSIFYLLLFFVITDSLGWSLKKIDFKIHWLYNMSILIQIPVYLNIYKRLIQDLKTQKTFKLFILIFISTSILSFFFFGFFDTFNTFNFFMGAILILITIIMFFSRVLKTDKIINITFYLWFWMSLGLFIFFVGSIPVFTAINLKFDTQFDSIYIIIYILNYIMYALFITGFLCSRKKLNSLLL